MKGAFFLGNREFEVRDMEKRPLAADEVRIRVMACGVCGTDVHIYHGEVGSAEVTPPVVLGHEYAGIVEEVGADVKGLVPGDHVAVDPNIYCGACTPCRDGKKQFCEHLQALGVTRDGGFAQYSAAPAAQCFKLALVTSPSTQRYFRLPVCRVCPLRQEPWPSRWRAACTVSMPRVYGPAVRYV